MVQYMGFVSSFSESCAASSDDTPHEPERPDAAAAAFTSLRGRVAAVLHEAAPDIAERWERQAREVALREQLQRSEADHRGTAVPLIEALATTLVTDGSMTDETVALGLAFGVEAFEQGASLHHMLKALDLLNAMVLYVVESTMSGEPAAEGGFADGVRLCRLLQQGSSLLTLASTKGYTQAVSDAIRDRFRHLRHDLRNPLGTIKTVLALMDDESVPADTRTHPRFRAMANRNARSLEDLIRARLSDAAALLPSLSFQRVSLRTVACSVRRDLRSEWEARNVLVSVANTRPRVHIDAVNLELLLRAVLAAALQEVTEGDGLIIDFGAPTAERATVILSCEPARAPVRDPGAQQRLMTLAAYVGAQIELGAQIIISVPVRRDDEVVSATGMTVGHDPVVSADIPADL
jgi:signal transduction histidine kinase